jgi:hypothetical protein
MDFEVPVSAGGDKNRKEIPSASQSPPALPSRQSPTPPAKRSSTTAGAAANGWSAVNGGNSSIPGTSTFSANPNANVPKKRKSAAFNPSNNHNSIAQAPPTHTSTRRAQAAASSKEARESNLFSFHKSGAKLKNGTLVADDGTVFSVNGECLLQRESLCLLLAQRPARFPVLLLIQTQPI